VRRAPQGARSTGNAASRPSAANGGSSSSAGTTGVRGPGSAVGRTGSSATADSSAFGVRTRDRAGRPITGFAAARTESDVRIIYFPFASPWGRWSPWYSSGFGWGGFGYLGYDPYVSPYYYRSPYGYPYYSRYDYNRAGSYGYEDEDITGELTGSIRFRAEPENARIYVNGALVGTVDDFNGLSDHLVLPAGVHQIEVRAEGYESYVLELTVEPGKTKTERFSLKKRQE
jgi:hypothetical protein